MPSIPKKKRKVKKKKLSNLEKLRRDAKRKGITIDELRRLRRSQAAKKGWATRRKNERKKKKREREAKKRREERHPEVPVLEREIERLRRRVSELEERRRMEDSLREFYEATRDYEYTLESKIIMRTMQILKQGYEFDASIARLVQSEFEDEFEDLSITNVYDIWYYGEMR